MVWSKSKIIVVIILIAVGSSVSTAFAVGGSNIIFKTFDGITNHEVMRITSDQKVGIGTSIPTSKVSVSGDIRTNGLTCPGCIDTTDISPLAWQLLVNQRIGTGVITVPGGQPTVHATCLTGEKVSGGGFSISGGDPSTVIAIESLEAPDGNNEAWYVTFKNIGTSTSTVSASAMCISLPSTIQITIPPGAGLGGCETTDSCFVPFSHIIHANAEVTWTNSDTVSHTIKSGKLGDSDAGSLFSSGLIPPGGTFAFIFTNTGTFYYFDETHPWMTGIIIVS